MSSRVSKVLSYLSANLPVSCEQIASDNISCLASIEQALDEGMARLGYEYVRYSYWNKGLIRDKPEINAYSVNFSNFPVEWEEYYNREKIYEYDPVIRYIQDETQKSKIVFGSWQDAYKKAFDHPVGTVQVQQEAYSKRVESMIRAAESHGLYGGYFYSWGDDYRHIVLSLATGKDTINHQDIDVKIIHSMVVLVNQAIQITQGCILCQKMLRVDGGSLIRLTRMELQILMLYYRHKDATLKQIATLSGRSVDTINYHLRALRHKLGMPGASGHSLASYVAELNLF